MSHFPKFNSIRDGLLAGQVPATYDADPNIRDSKPQEILVENFSELIKALEAVFWGLEPPDFGAVMPTVGASIHNCWRSRWLFVSATGTTFDAGGIEVLFHGIRLDPMIRCTKLAHGISATKTRTLSAILQM